MQMLRPYIDGHVGSRDFFVYVALRYSWCNESDGILTCCLSSACRAISPLHPFTPSRTHPLLQIRLQLRHRHPLLRHRVAITHRDGLIFERLEIDRQAERRADLILAAVELAD